MTRWLFGLCRGEERQLSLYTAYAPAAGMITAGGVERAAKIAGQSVRTGLVNSKKLNATLGM